MKISSVHIENFRSFSDAEIPLNDYACLVGPNGAGKSTVLTALNLFFRESENIPTDLGQLSKEDFHCENVDVPIRITITFTDLSREAQEDFADYFRQGKLVISAFATYNTGAGKAEVKQYGQRSGMLTFAPFFRAASNGVKASQLQDIYADLKGTLSDLPPAKTTPAMKTALRDYEAEHPEQCELIPSEDQFYGFSKGANRLAKHVQWVYIPAVKDPTSEQVEARNSALGKLLARTVRSKTDFDEIVKTLREDMQSRYQTLLDDKQNILDGISTALQSRLSKWAHPDARLKLQWKQDPGKSVRVEEPCAHIVAGEGRFDGELARFGHGFQRSFLLALLQLLAETDATDAPTLILACEEPELYQHPPQARHLAAVLHSLSHSDSQIIVSTHSPMFVSGEGFEDVRMVRKDPEVSCSFVSHLNFAEIAQAFGDATGTPPPRPNRTLARIHQTLQSGLNEMFFTQQLILVEGLEDMAYLSTYFNLLELSDNYRRAGCHIVPANGKSELLQPLIIAKHMGIPTYVVFDADADKEDRGGSRKKHEKDNSALLHLLDAGTEKAMPKETIGGKGFTMWQSDIGAIVREDIGEEDWSIFHDEASRIYGHLKKKGKNVLHLGATLALAWNAGKRSCNLNDFAVRF